MSVAVTNINRKTDIENVSALICCQTACRGDNSYIQPTHFLPYLFDQCAIKSFFVIGSPATLPGSSPAVPGADFFSLASTGINPSALLPPPGAFLPPSGLLPFAPHPTDLTMKSLHQSGLNPYDTFTNLSRSFQSNTSSADALSVRLSPTSSRQSVTPPAPSKSPDKEINSTNDANSSDDSEDETIEVVKSAFHPARTASLELLERDAKRRKIEPREIQHPDSTVQDKPKLKNSAGKIRGGSASPTSTKISASVSTHKTVWRPY